MRTEGIAGQALAAAVLLGLAACATATRPMIEPTPQALTEKKRGVAVVKFVMPGEDCLQHVLTIGMREGNGHRMLRRLFARGHAPATTANAAEIELDAGEYQVLGYLCQRQRSFVSVGNQGGPYTAAIGGFTVAPGEVVNIGQLAFRKVWGSAAVTLAITDWSLADLNRYRDERPQLFAAMKTRLLVATAGKPLSAEHKEQTCAEMKAMHDAGKLQNLPKGCT